MSDKNESNNSSTDAAFRQMHSFIPRLLKQIPNKLARALLSSLNSHYY